MVEIKLFSLIMPAYRQADTIEEDLMRVIQVLAKLKCKKELIVVVDGIVDKTVENIKKVKCEYLKVYSYPKNRGKGFAVRYGVLKAKGDVIGFLDSGMDIDPEAIPELLKILTDSGADIVIGSKLHPGSNVDFPLYRSIISSSYRRLTHFLFDYDIADTQVGLKLFKGDVARRIFSKLKVDRYAFDVEVFAVAYATGSKNIKEAPVKVSLHRKSSVNPKTYIEVFVDTLGVFYRLKIKKDYGKSI